MSKGYGSVDLFGLNEFGEPKGLAPHWGVLAGVGTQTAGAMLVRGLTKMDKWAEAIGTLAGCLVGGTLMFFGNTKGAGFTTIVSSVAAGIPRQVEAYFYYDKVEKYQKAYDAYVKSLPAEAQKPFQTALPAPQLQGLGIPAVEQTQLMGAGPKQLQMLGGPQMGGIASAFGANHFHRN